MMDVPAHRFKQRPCGLCVFFPAADEDGERALSGTGITAGHRRIEHPQVLLPAQLCQLLRQLRRRSRHIDEQLTLTRMSEDPAFAHIHFAHIIGEADHGDHHIAGAHA